MSARIDKDSIAFANKLADAAGEVIRPFFRKPIEVIDKSKSAPKPLFDPVTEADRNAETAMRALIKAQYPDDGILGEEHGNEEGKSGRTWILDPIDGTRAFITGRHTWGTLIALYEDDVPVLGIIDQPVLGERFIGYPGTTELVTANSRQKMRTRKCDRLAAAVVSTTHPWGYFNREERTAFEDVCAAARMSYFGGDCYGYALLAMGFIDVVIEARLAPWDVAALIPVVQNAGGIMSDWKGKPLVHGARVIAAGDPRVHEEVVKLLARVSSD